MQQRASPRFRSLTLALALLGLAFVAPQAYDYTGTSWSFAEAKVKFSGKAKGIGKLKGTELGAGSLALNTDGTWGLVYDGDLIAGGSWDVQDEFDKSVELVLDGDGLTDLPTFLEDNVESAAALFGFVIDTELTTLELEKVRLKVMPNKKAGTVKAKIVAVYKYTGTTDGEGEVDAVSSVRAKLTGTSDELPLADILP